MRRMRYIEERELGAFARLGEYRRALRRKFDDEDYELVLRDFFPCAEKLAAIEDARVELPVCSGSGRSVAVLVFENPGACRGLVLSRVGGLPTIDDHSWPLRNGVRMPLQFQLDLRALGKGVCSSLPGDVLLVFGEDDWCREDPGQCEFRWMTIDRIRRLFRAGSESLGVGCVGVRWDTWEFPFDQAVRTWGWDSAYRLAGFDFSKVGGWPSIGEAFSEWDVLREGMFLGQVVQFRAEPGEDSLSGLPLGQGQYVIPGWLGDVGVCMLFWFRGSVRMITCVNM